MTGIIEELLNISDYGYYKFLLNQDPIRGKIEDNMIDYLIEESVNCGIEEAEKILKRFKNKDIFEIASELDIEVEYTNSQENGYYGYFEEPKKIVIYNKSVDNALEFFRENTDISIDKIYLNEIILGHELFHFIESENPNLFINTFKIDLWSIFKYKRSSNIIYLGEIAAMAFINRMLNKNTYLQLLDYIMLYNLDEKSSELLVQELLKFND